MTPIARPYSAAVLATGILLALKYIRRYLIIPRAVRSPAQRAAFLRILGGLSLLAVTFLTFPIIGSVPGGMLFPIVILLMIGIFLGIRTMSRGLKEGMTVLEEHPPAPHETRAARRQRDRDRGAA